MFVFFSNTSFKLSELSFPFPFSPNTSSDTQTNTTTRTIHTQDTPLLVIGDYYLLARQARGAAARTPYGTGTQTSSVTEGGTDIWKGIL